MHAGCFGPSSRASSHAQQSNSVLGGCTAPRNVGCRVRDSSSEGIGPLPSLSRQNTMRVAASSLSVPFEDSEADWNSQRSRNSSQASTSAAAQETEQRAPRAKPLKINLDLALFRARSMRQQAYRQTNATKRKTMLEDTEATLLRCMAMDPTDGRSYVSLGRLYVQQRRYDEAEAVFDRGCTATRGSNAFIWTSWANLEAKRGNVASARKMYDAATVADETHAAAWHGWGLLEKREGNYLRARDLWLTGVQKTRTKPNPYLYQSLAVLAADLKRPDEARTWFKAGTSTPMCSMLYASWQQRSCLHDPPMHKGHATPAPPPQGGASHAMWQAWALLEAEQGNATLVRQLFRKGLEASPRSRYIYLSWALWEQRLGNTANARRLLERGHDLNRTDPAILQAWAMLEGREGNMPRARALFEKAVAVDASHLYVWQAWGVLEFRSGNPSRARELFQRGVWADPSSPSVALVFQAWAVLERAAGDYAAARALFKCAVKADPRSSPSWMAWAAMEEDLGLYFNARELRNRNLQAQVEVVLPEQLLKDPAKVEQTQTLKETLSAWFETVRARPSRRRGAVEQEEGDAVRESAREVGRMRAMGNVDGVQLTEEFFPGEGRAGVKVARPVVPDDFDSEFDRVLPLVNTRSSSS